MGWQGQRLGASFPQSLSLHKICFHFLANAFNFFLASLKYFLLFLHEEDYVSFQPPHQLLFHFHYICWLSVKKEALSSFPDLILQGWISLRAMLWSLLWFCNDARGTERTPGKAPYPLLLSFHGSGRQQNRGGGSFYFPCVHSFICSLHICSRSTSQWADTDFKAGATIESKNSPHGTYGLAMTSNQQKC